MSALATHAGHRDLIIGLAVVVPLLLIVMQVMFGDGIPAAIFLGVAAFDVWVLPRFPSSPVACLNVKPQGCTGRGLDWVIWTAFVIPIGLAVLYKQLRGDTRSETGTRMP